MPSETTSQFSVSRTALSTNGSAKANFVLSVTDNNKQQFTNQAKLMKKKILFTIGLVALLVSATDASQQQLAKSISDTRAESMRTADQLSATLQAINALTAQKEGDLRPAYNAFCAQVAKTEAAAAWTRTRCQWMASDGRKYFADWQDTINGISNESLRKKAQKRMDNVRKSYDRVEASLQLAGEKFKPFLSDLSDIQKALAADVTAGGVKAIKSTVRSANWNDQFVNKAIQAALKEMNKMEKALSTEAK